VFAEGYEHQSVTPFAYDDSACICCTLWCSDVGCVPQDNKWDNAVADDDRLKTWLKKNAGSTRGFTIKTADGGSAPLYPPYHMGDDFVAGSVVEERDEQCAYPYSCVVSIRPMAAKPRAFFGANRTGALRGAP
jgi:hypothetical protein